MPSAHFQGYERKLPHVRFAQLVFQFNANMPDSRAHESLVLRQRGHKCQATEERQHSTEENQVQGH